MITALVDPLGFTLVEIPGDVTPFDFIRHLERQGLAYKTEIVQDFSVNPPQTYLQAEEPDGNKRVIGYVRKRGE